MRRQASGLCMHFDARRAIIANAGSPANILMTTDGGDTWKVVYTNTHEAAFIDGVDFWNSREGLIYGDPIDGKMLLLKTTDGGSTWSELPGAPTLNEGEASFAASGTGIRCIGKQQAYISTGGITSRLWKTTDKGATWSALTPPIVQGGEATGIYSFAVSNKIIVLAGGDYTNPELATRHNLYSDDGGISWHIPAVTARGYRECVEFVAGKTLLTTGPGGTDISYNSGMTWNSFSDHTGFHVVRKARQGKLIVIAGNNGQLGLIE